VIQLDPRLGLPAAPSMMDREDALQALDQIVSAFGGTQEANRPPADGATTRLAFRSVVPSCVHRRLMRRTYPPLPTPQSMPGSRRPRRAELPLEALAEQRGEPASRVAAQMIATELEDKKDLHRARTSAAASAPTENTDPDRRAPWIEPFLDYKQWRAPMWGSIVALYGRYPRELVHLKDGWVGRRFPCRDVMRPRGLTGLDRSGRRRSATRAGVSGTACRPRSRAPAGGWQRHERLEARRRARWVDRAVGPATAGATVRTPVHTLPARASPVWLQKARNPLKQAGFVA
jgi:hypothetical protein